GMGVPRPSVRIVEEDGRQRLVSPATGEDFTAPMRRFAKARVAELEEQELDGYVLKKNSPSCGMARVAVHLANGAKRHDGAGFFARELVAAWPHLPVEEEGRL